MQYHYSIEGEIYFCVNYYQRSDYTTNNEIVDRDVWTEPFSTGFGANDGMLVYPGQKYGIYGPITTCRLETIRNSQEDYELFYMIDQRINKYNELHSTSYNSCADILASYLNSIFAGTTKVSPSLTFTTFENYRSMLLDIVEELY